jgi:hypothetical protein
MPGCAFLSFTYWRLSPGLKSPDLMEYGRVWRLPTTETPYGTVSSTWPVPLFPGLV